MNKRLRFLIASPRYNHQTAGVMVLHELCDMLNRQGYEAAIVLFGGSGPHFHWAFSNAAEFYHPNHQRTEIPFEDANLSIQEYLKDGVVIYPDLVPDNPLNAPRVVRFLLYKNHGYRAQGPSEYVLSFSQMFHDSADGYLFKTFVDPALHDRGARHWRERTLDLCYIGKGMNFTACHHIPGTLALSRSWPEDKAQLGMLLRECRYLFTWDTVSQTNVDAIACGAIPVLLQEHQASRTEINSGELGDYPDVHLTDLNDARSVQGDAAQIERQVAAMQRRILQYQHSWPDRVKAFAEDLHRFYAFAQESP